MEKTNWGDQRRSRNSSKNRANRRITYYSSTTTTKASHKYLLFVIVVVIALPKLVQPADALPEPFGKLFKGKGAGGAGENSPKLWTIDLNGNTENRGGGQGYQMTSKKNVKKKRELTEHEKRDISDTRILRFIHISNIIHTILLLRGKGFDVGIDIGTAHSSTVVVLVSSMFCTKLSTFLNYPDLYHCGAMHKTFISLTSSAIAYCFDSRSIEKLGGVYLAFIQFMALGTG